MTDWLKALRQHEADVTDTPMDIRQNCDAEGGFVVIESADRERWVDCPVCGGAGWVEV